MSYMSYGGYAKYIYIYIKKYHITTHVGHRLIHQSALDESSGHKSTVCLHGIAFRIDLGFSRIAKKLDKVKYEPFWKKHVVKKEMASLDRHKRGLGMPIHIKMTFI